MPPGMDSRARRRALNLDVVVVEADAFAGQLVDARRRYGSTVHPEISPADVVHQDEDDVWQVSWSGRVAGRLRRGGRSQAKRSRSDQYGQSIVETFHRLVLPLAGTERMLCQHE